MIVQNNKLHSDKGRLRRILLAKNRISVSLLFKRLFLGDLIFLDFMAGLISDSSCLEGTSLETEYESLFGILFCLSS